MSSPAGRVRVTASLILDVAATILAYIFAPELRRLVDPWVRQYLGEWTFNEPVYLLFLTFIVPVWTVALGISGCYRAERRTPLAGLAARVLRALVVSHLLLAVAAFYVKQDILSRGVMLIFFATNFAGIILGRALIAIVSRAGTRRRTVVVGAGRLAARLARALEQEEGHDIVGFVSVSKERAVAEDRVLGAADEMPRILAAHTPVDEVAVALAHDKVAAAAPAVRAAEERGVTVRQIVRPLGEEPRRARLEHVGGIDTLSTYPSPGGAGELLVKRLLDIAGAAVGLLATLAVLPFVAAAIKLTSGGPVFYGQRRTGLAGRVFTIRKFRTMVVGAHDMRDELAELNMMKGPRFKITSDPRVTLVGRLLRRLSIDELPQFWNVLKGDMSIVGPRPFPADESEAYKPRHYRRLSMRPGLTGLWQTRGRCEVTDFDEILRMDEEYIRNWSLWLDVKIILKTIPTVLGGRGAM
ncbi:MAG: sugar transferase [Planctomycetota bacterium]